MRAYQRATAMYAREILKGAAAGTLAGLAGAWVMTRFQELVSKAGELRSRARMASQNRRQESRNPQGGEPTTVKTAVAISEHVFHHELARQHRAIAGSVVHYTFGTSMGALYGAMAEVLPAVTIGRGLPAATLLWVAADETMLPLLGLSSLPWKYPLSTHAYAMASHLVYGAVAEKVRSTLRGGTFLRPAGIRRQPGSAR